MNGSFSVAGLELTLDSADIVEADADGVTVTTRDGLTLKVDGAIADRIVAAQTQQRQAEANVASLGWAV